MSEPLEVRIPDIGDFADIPVIELPVSPGDQVAEGDTVVVLESDKATLDVPSPAAGTVLALSVALGDKVSEGALILTLTAADTAGPAAPQAAPDTQARVEPTPPTPATLAPTATAPPSPEESMPSARADLPVGNEGGVTVHAAPSTRRYARQLGVDIAEVTGTGPKNRITRGDIETFVKSRMLAPPPSAGHAPAAFALLPDWPQVDYAKFGPTERMPLSRIARIAGPALARNAMVIPHVTNFDKSDVTELEAFRKRLNAEAAPDDAKLTMLAFAVKAVVSALKAYPKFNSSLDDDALVLKNYWNIGVAADTPDGLVVPVVKAADQKGLRQIAQEMVDLAGAARTGKLKPTDMQGATFTISSLGGIGGTNFTPIINAPEVAILGMPRSEVQPVWDGNAFQPRLIQPLGLSFDHRVVDGVAAARFLAHVAATLSDLRRLSL